MSSREYDSARVIGQMIRVAIDGFIAGLAVAAGMLLVADIWGVI